MECNFFGFQAPAESLVLFARGLQLVTRPGVFTEFDLYKVYLPLISFEVVSSAQSPITSSVLHLL